MVELAQKEFLSRLEVCLAIGDGSNDVPMIHTAGIGVGIRGNEGSEAATNSDYAIAEFQQLKRLLFFHGLNFNYKLTYHTLVFLFKTQIFAFVPFFFSLDNGFSAAEPYPDVLYVLY